MEARSFANFDEIKVELLKEENRKKRMIEEIPKARITSIRVRGAFLVLYIFLKSKRDVFF